MIVPIPMRAMAAGLIETARSQPVVLDDLDEALGQLTDLGRCIVAPLAGLVRKAVIPFAIVRGWRVVKHASFAAWAESLGCREDWQLVLDPVFPIASLGEKARRVRLTRSRVGDQWQITSRLPMDLEGCLSGGTVNVLDDACAHGRTLRHLHDLVSEIGARICSVILCSSMAKGRSAVTVALPGVAFSVFLNGDYDALHLRDGCPGLPFSGRRASRDSAIVTDRGLIPVCVPPTAYRGGLWDTLHMDGGVRWALVGARWQLADRLSAALGRPATVADISLLGSDVGVPLFPKQAASANTPLAQILA